MSKKNEEWRKEFKSWRSMYPNLVIHKSNKSDEERVEMLITSIKRRAHIALGEFKILKEQTKQLAGTTVHALFDSHVYLITDKESGSKPYYLPILFANLASSSGI